MDPPLDLVKPATAEARRLGSLHYPKLKPQSFAAVPTVLALVSTTAISLELATTFRRGAIREVTSENTRNTIPPATYRI